MWSGSEFSNAHSGDLKFRFDFPRSWDDSKTCHRSVAPSKIERIWNGYRLNFEFADLGDIASRVATPEERGRHELDKMNFFCIIPTQR
jgi:hypothetical protein